MVEFQFWPAVTAGVIGGAVMFGTRLMMKKVVGLDLKMDVTLMMPRRAGMPDAKMVRLLMHLVVSGLIALVYAWGFEYIFGARDNFWLWGLLGGAIHWGLGGFGWAGLASTPSLSAVLVRHLV